MAKSKGKKEKKNPFMKKLIKHSKALNELDLIEEKIDVKQNEEDLKEDFITAIEEIDDDGQADEVDDDILDFYESLIEVEVEEEEEPEEEEFDLEEMDEDELDDLKKERKIKIKGWKKMDEDEKREALEDALEDEEEEEEEEEKKPKKESKKKEKDKKADKKKKSKKDKKQKKKSENKVKGLRSGTLPHVLYTTIAEGEEKGATMKKLAEIAAKEKRRDADKCVNLVMRTIARKVSKAANVTAIFKSGDELKTVFVIDDE